MLWSRISLSHLREQHTHCPAPPNPILLECAGGASCFTDTAHSTASFEPSPPRPTPPHPIPHRYAQELKDLGKVLAAQQGSEDVAHLNKIVLWQRSCTAVGLLTAAVAPNPLTMFALAAGCMTRWTIVAHHVCHGGFDKCDTGGRYNRFSFGVGSLYRRCTDWLDWMLVEAWNVEHNQLHHYCLGEDKDPDLVERNLKLIRDLPTWMLPLKYAVTFFMMCTWKWYYYSPNTFKMLKLHQRRREGKPTPWTAEEQEAPCVVGSWLTPWYGKFFTNVEFFGRVLGPFFAVRFLLLPALCTALYVGAYQLLGGSAPVAEVARSAYMSSLINFFFGELLTNAWSFLNIATNHCGDDLYRFEGHAAPRSPSFYLRQVTSSVNFTTGTDFGDFCHGWLNYQIEHHLWPDLSMRSYQKAQPLVEAICKKHGVPYVQHNVWWRLKKTVDIIVGNNSMRRYPAEYNRVADMVE